MGTTTLYGLPYPDGTSSPYTHLDIQALAAAVEQELGVRTLYAADRTSQAGPVSNVPASAIEVSGLTGSFTLTRKTRVRLQFDAEFFVSVADTAGRVELRLNGTNYRLVALQASFANSGANCSAGRNITLAAGTYTAQVFLSREFGTGAVTLDGSTTTPIQFTITSLGAVP